MFSYKIRDRAIGADNKFQINPTTGVINVTGDLDYESGNIDYEFTVSRVLSIFHKRNPILIPL